MTLTLATGAKLELADLPAIDKAIDSFEAELNKLRRLRKVTAELTGAPPRAKKKADDEEDDEEETPPAKTAPATA